MSEVVDFTRQRTFSGDPEAAADDAQRWLHLFMQRHGDIWDEERAQFLVSKLVQAMARHGERAVTARAQRLVDDVLRVEIRDEDWRTRILVEFRPSRQPMLLA